MEKVSMAVNATLDGFDPLGEQTSSSDALALSQVFEESRKRDVQNILKSYTGTFDLFSELLQNSLDAVQARDRLSEPGYKPHVWVYIDIPDRIVKVIDNGIGMNEEQFKFCLRPSVSFKKQADLRGHKGVGASFLAYGFSFMKMQTKRDGKALAVILRQGRQWTEDTSGTIPRPKLEAVDFMVPEIANETSGTSVEIIVGSTQGERPRDLSWLGARNAEQWYNVLRIKTPLGGVYLSSMKFAPRITIKVRSSDKEITTLSTERAEYYYPHEIPNLKVKSLGDVSKAADKIAGDSQTKLLKLDPEFKRLHCVYDIWDKDQILEQDSYFYSALSDEQKELAERHNVIVYGAFLHSARLWAEFNDETLGLRKGQRIIHGGLQIASDFMTQGELFVIPLTSAIGYQANSHVIVHFTDGNPDMGRKVFQPELTKLAEVLAVRCVTAFRRFLQYVRPDTGSQSITPDKEVHDWKRAQEEYRDRNPLSLAFAGRSLAHVSKPQQEQDAIALFHELIGAGILRGYKFFGTSQSDRYDSVFFMNYIEADNVLYEAKTNRLGVNRNFSLPYTTEPKILEYKFAFESLVADFEKEGKFSKHVDFVVCWSAGEHYKERFYLQPLLVGDEGSSRQIFGATHQVFSVGAQEHPAFELLILDDLIAWLQDPAGEEARQKTRYRDN
jgi:Histidine kinase-, DNA gyrase B-, and HSP90-like ATPase